MKFIRATDLDAWARTHTSRTALSEMVSALIRASVPDPSYIHFPKGDAADIPGYDGSLVATGAPPYVPEGQSVWELGTDADYLGKANDEFERRSKAPGEFDPKETTFVFVTPRTWKGTSRKKPKKKKKATKAKKKRRGQKQVTLPDWEKAKAKHGPWRNVRVIDGVALEAWLEDCPAVASRLAREMLPLLPRTGARSTDEFWDEFASRFQPQLTEEVLLCGRKDESAQLLPQLSSGAATYALRGDSPEEVIAFAVASIRKAEPDLRKFLEARTLVVESRDAAQSLAGRKNLSFLIYPAAATSAGLLSKDNPVLVPLGREDLRRGGSALLKRPTAYEMGEALRTMGYPQESAIQLARKVGRSVTVLARQIPSTLAPRPGWAEDANLVPALIASAWNAENVEDCKIMSAIAGTDSYEAYEKTLRKYLKRDDSPLEHEGAAWQLVSPVDAFVHLAYLVGAEHLGRLLDAAKGIFAEEDPALDMSPGEKILSEVTGKKLKHSHWLRDGIATTLLLFATLAEGADLHVPGGAQSYVNGLVASLPGLAKDWRLLASLRWQLPLLAEAAPRPLAEALEQMLEGEPEKVRPMFQDTDAIFSSSPHTGLLWALETVAWEPEYLARVALILARLARIDPGGKLVNRPIESLRAIFLAWMPNTRATLAERLAALDYIVANEPIIGWQLLLKLLPENHSVGSRTAMPRFREAGPSEEEPITYGLVWKTYTQIIDRVVRLAGDDPTRWAAVISEMATFTPSQRDQVCELLKLFAVRSGAAERAIVWAALRNFVNRHRAFQSAPWSVKTPELDKFEALLPEFEPEDLTTKIGWLFDDYHPAIPTENFDKSDEALQDARYNAVNELYANGGPAAVINLAESVKFSRLLGFTVAVVVKQITAIGELLDLAFGRGETLNEFSAALSAGTDQRYKEQWREFVRARHSTSAWTPQQLVTVVLWWRDEPETWAFVASLGADVERGYWLGKQVWPLQPDARVLEIAARKYLSVGRAISALEVLHRAIKDVSSGLVFEALDRAISEFAAPSNRTGPMTLYELETIFAGLSKRADIPAFELAKREYAYLPLLRYSNIHLTLHSIMETNPEFFVSVLCDAFRAAGAEKAEPDEQQRMRAQSAYKLLSEMTVLPGASGDEIDASILNAWIDGVRKEAALHDRSKIADEYIGHILAHSPPDEDGSWPNRVVRDVVERLKSNSLESGILIERFNMRGVVTKAMYEGGKQERTLSAVATKWAKMAQKWPRTQAMLLRLSEDWKRWAEHEDVRAKQDEMKFER
jgi:hypothetical protein